MHTASLNIQTCRRQWKYAPTKYEHSQPSFVRSCVQRARAHLQANWGWFTDQLETIKEMVYVDGRGNIVRPCRGMPGGMLCVVGAIAAVMVQTVPSLAELKDHRARADGLWLSPTVEWHAKLGVAAVAKAGDAVHVGVFGRWLAPADLVPKQLRPRLEAVAADDAQVLLAVIVLIYVMHVLRPRWLFLRHFAASAEALRAGRYWSLLLAAVAHADLMHVAFNCLALSCAAPALQTRLRHDRVTFWCFVVLAALASSLASVFGHTQTGYSETKGASGVIFAMLAHAAATNPAAPSSLYGMVEMPAATALVAMLAVDALVRSKHGIDYASHAGGALFGLAFYEIRRYT